MDKLRELASHLPGATKLQNGDTHKETHPFDPLETSEIDFAVSLINKEKTPKHAPHPVWFNAVAVAEPKKQDMLAWLDAVDQKLDAAEVEKKKPKRIADVVAIVGGNGGVWDGLVDLSEGEMSDAERVLKWEKCEGVQPLITMEDLKVVEGVCRKDAKVIEQCGIIGIPPEDMHKVYCDPWTIGYDARFGSNTRLQQALMYYRPHPDDNQYTYPLDFTPIFNADSHEIIHIDVPERRRPLNKANPSNYHAAATQSEKKPTHPDGTPGFRNDIKPINITQPEGVSFKLDGHMLTWLNWRVHVGFNYREGIVLNDVRFWDRDQGKERSIFWRISLAEMVVPYGNPEHPHQRKHAFDLGEYGGGYMTNSLSLGCDCKGTIAYLPFHHVTRSGPSATIANAICIHEEDAGILYKHTDFRDDTSTSARNRKLVISHIFTAANYEYCVYWNLHMDGTLSLDVKLTGILNTYAIDNDGYGGAPATNGVNGTANGVDGRHHDKEQTNGYGTIVYPGVNAHNHQHLFCLRIDPRIDNSSSNTVLQSDAVTSTHPVGSAQNQYGNAFFAQKTRLETAGQGVCKYDGNTSRTWDMVNESRKNRFSGMSPGYKLVSREVPPLLPKEGGLVWKRAGFARNAVHVSRYDDNQIHPAGRHVPQTSGESTNPQNLSLPDWIAADPSAPIADSDIVLWHTFGLTHFPAPEDFPIMPAEPMTVLLRPRHFFERNPALDVPPSFSSWPSQVEKVERPYGVGCGESRGV